MRSSKSSEDHRSRDQQQPEAPNTLESATGGSTTLKSQRLEDDDATELLEWILELRRDVELDRKPARHRALTAARYCNMLIRGIMEWAAVDMQLLRSPAEYRQLSLDERRVLIALSIGFGLPVLQQEARREIGDGLFALQGGQQTPLLKRKAGRRRTASFEAAEAEFDLLRWIRWQHGRGRRVADAETDVSQAVGCTREAIQKWRLALPKVFGERRFKDQLLIAEAVGSHERRAGRDVDYRPWDSDTGQVLSLGSLTLSRDLAEIAARRRAAVAKRRVERPSAA